MVTAYSPLPPGYTELPPGIMEQWGHGIFENGSNLDVVAAFDKKAGLKKLQNQVNAITSDPAKHVTYSIYAKQCSGPHAVESVRKHLNSGVLAKLAAKQIQSYFNPLKVSDWTCQGQTCCILAACAMSLGCITFTDLEGYHSYFDSYVKFTRGILPGSAISNNTAFQLKQALETFTPGTPYDFGSKSADEAAEEEMKLGFTAAQASPCWIMCHGGRSVHEQIGSPRPAGVLASMVGPCSKGDLGYENKPGACGGCLKPGATNSCGRCKDMFYCDNVCQKADWHRHQKVCRSPEDAKAMRENAAMWTNTFDLGLEGGSSALFGKTSGE